MTPAAATQNVFLLEGQKLENVPGDLGGLTKNGYTQGAYDSYRDSKKLPRQSVALMTVAETFDAYDADYWDPAGCGELPDGLDFVHFQWAVNHGVVSATRCLKLAVYGRPQVGQLDGPVDAGIGLVIASWRSLSTIEERYLVLQSAVYDRVAQAHVAGQLPTELKFFNGWENRIQRVRDILAGRPLSV